MTPRDAEVDGFVQGGFPFGVVEYGKGVFGKSAIVAGTVQCIGKGAVTLHELQGMGQIRVGLVGFLHGALPE